MHDRRGEAIRNCYHNGTTGTGFHELADSKGTACRIALSKNKLIGAVHASPFSRRLKDLGIERHYSLSSR
jgi:hypothetical protein